MEIGCNLVTIWFVFIEADKINTKMEFASTNIFPSRSDNMEDLE